MELIIERILREYETGKLTRRGLVTALAGLAAASTQAAAAPPDFRAVSVNHVTLRVSDVARSTKFYQDVFGMPLKTESPTLKLLALNKNCFFGIEAANQKAPAVDHFSLGIQGFKLDDAVQKLKKRGITAEPGKDSLKFNDADGITVQLNAPDYPGYLP